MYQYGKKSRLPIRTDEASELKRMPAEIAQGKLCHAAQTILSGMDEYFRCVEINCQVPSHCLGRTHKRWVFDATACIIQPLDRATVAETRELVPMSLVLVGIRNKIRHSAQSRQPLRGLYCWCKIWLSTEWDLVNAHCSVCERPGSST